LCAFILSQTLKTLVIWQQSKLSDDKMMIMMTIMNQTKHVHCYHRVSVSHKILAKHHNKNRTMSIKANYYYSQMKS